MVLNRLPLSSLLSTSFDKYCGGMHLFFEDKELHRPKHREV
jgi:hypothetical protein